MLIRNVSARLVATARLPGAELGTSEISKGVSRTRGNRRVPRNRETTRFYTGAAPSAAPSPSGAQQQQRRAAFDEEDEEEKPEQLPLHCIFKVFAIMAPPNYFLPWQKKTSREFTGSGFVVKTKYGPKLLTNAHVVANATTVRIRRSGSSQMFRAKGYECDLAELEVDDPTFWDEPDTLGDMPMTLDQMYEGADNYPLPDVEPQPVVPHDDQPVVPPTTTRTATPTVEMMHPDPTYKYGLELGGLPELHSRVTVAGYPTGGDNISVTRGVVSRIEPQPYAYSPVHQLLAIQIDAAINPGNSGGPAVDQYNRVVGVAFQSLQGADNIGYIIPLPIINHFIEDVHRSGGSNPLGGFVRIGVNTQMLDNTLAARQFFHMKKNQTGLLTNFVDPVSDASNYLKKDDIILAIDGVPIANDGTVPFRNRERISFDYLLTNKYVGDSCAVTVLRDSKRLTFNIKLKPKSVDLVPVHGAEADRMPTYLVYGGLVFSKLTIAYLSEYGEDWYNTAPRQLVYKALHSFQQYKDQEIVLLSHVLVDDCNYGYNSYLNIQLKKFNGVDVLNLQHLDQLLESTTNEFSRFDLDEFATIILNHREAVAAAPRIMENHGLPALKSKHFLNKPPPVSTPTPSDAAASVAAAAAATATPASFNPDAYGAQKVFKL